MTCACLITVARFVQSTTSDGTSRPHDHTSQESGTGQDPGQNELGTEKSGCGIQPSHVREALRRLSVPSGPLLPLAVSLQE